MAVSVNEVISVGFVVQFLLSLCMLFGGAGKHRVNSDGTDVFRINRAIAWMATISSFAISGILAYGIAVTKPTPMDAPIAIMLGELLFFFFGLYGLWGLAMRIRIDSDSIRVDTPLGTRVTHFNNVRSSTDKVTGRYRTFDVINDKGKRILRVTSTFLPDYEELVQLVEQGVRAHRSHKT